MFSREIGETHASHERASRTLPERTRDRKNHCMKLSGNHNPDGCRQSLHTVKMMISQLQSKREVDSHWRLAALVFLLGCVPYIMAEEEEEEGGGEIDRKNYWIAHGVCASVAWTIIVPLAIGSALLRTAFVGETWFQIHRGLNILAAILTTVAFGIAVYLIRESDGKSPWMEYPHFVVGLTIFIATMLQAISGIIRPRHSVEPKQLKEVKAAQDSDEENAEALDTPTTEPKTMLRRMWEVMHRIFGICLLGTAWWQIQDGWKLYEEEIGGQDVGMGFMGCAGGIAGTIAILYMLELARRQS